MRIPIFQITVNSGRRAVNLEAVQRLSESISKVGLLNPITVDQENTLIAGLHRLEAAKLLGWTEIECAVSGLGGLLAQLAEIDENLIRRGLDHVEEWEQLARRKEIYEKLHPETRQGQRNGQTAKNETVSVLDAKPFTQDTADKLGVSPRSIEQKIQVAKNLTPEVKGIVKEHDIGFKNALKLSRLPPELQADAARQLAVETIHSVDEYISIPTEPQLEPPNKEHTLPEVPTTISKSETGYYATTRDSVADLKNPDKDRSRTPDTFLASFSFFLQRFCQGVLNYSSPEYALVFPALTQVQLDQIRQEVNSTCSVLRHLLHNMERTAQK